MSPTRVGELRPSQLLRTFGPGSLVDLPHLSVLVSGIDGWPSDPRAAPEVTERRLLSAVQRSLGDQVQALRLPPHLPETTNPFDDWARTGVPVQPFPSWVRCPACGRIGPAGEPLFKFETHPYWLDRACFRHANCQKVRGKAPPAVPVRYLLACRAGHLDDFPWEAFVHQGPVCGSAILTMYELNQSSGPDDVWIRCGCGASRSMVAAFGEGSDTNLPRCRGRHPHLRTFSEGCDESVRTLLLGASNTWFSVMLEVLALPEADTPVAQLVAECWPQLAAVDSLATLTYALQNVPALAALSSEDPEAVWTAVVARRDGQQVSGAEDTDLRGPEWLVLSKEGYEANYPEFQTHEVAPPHTPNRLIRRVMAIDRLREAEALIGFSRIDAPGELELRNPEAEFGPLSQGKPTWVPCTEVRGEGLFIQFREEAISAWEDGVTDCERLDRLHIAHQRFRHRRGLDSQSGWPGPRYVALHTVSHLLMRELALECGYGSASIKERIYGRPQPDAMAGILLYSSAPDSEGTLGGLVGLAEPDTLGRLLDQALQHGRRCASDPICAEHIPSQDEDVLHGAACHACLFAPETSCERANRYLDRALAVRTFGADLGLFA